ncbi:MAG TPA: apolipoprotein N-acyltransferase [Actinomycetota bacterium]
MQELLPGQTPEPARGQEEDALPRLRLTSASSLGAFAAAATGGLVLSLAFPPAGIWPLAFVAPIPLLWALRDATPRRGALVGLVFGLVGYGAILYWILRFGELAFGALTLLSASSVALFGLLLPLLRRPDHPVRNAIGAAALWTVIDHLRGLWPFGGFTWGALGVSQADDRALIPLAVVTGVAGVTFVVVFVAALVGEAAWGGGERNRRLGRIGLAAAVALAPLAIPFSTPNGDVLDVASLQVDVRVPPGTSTAEGDRIVAARHIALSDRLAQEGDPPDLVLWGEGALDPAAASDPAVLAEVRAAVARAGAPAVIGAVIDDPDGSQHTSVLAFDAEGADAGRYDKVHLVPYGEYVPFRERLDFLEVLDQIPVDRVPGEEIHTIAPGGLPPLGTPICFENSFPGLPRAFVRAGAEFLVVPVNNASYGFTAASDQHLQMSRIRAVETGRWVVDAAISGVSAFIAPDGRVISETGLYREVILRGQVRTSTEITPYVRWGDWFVWACAFVTMGIAIAPPRRRSAERGQPGPLPALPRVLVILPTFKEAATIARVLEGLLSGPPGVEVLVVDDASPDGTGAIVAEIAADDPRVRLLERPAKSGLASAYADGFAIALDGDYDLVVEMDADLSHDPSELASLLAAAARYDLVVGSRYVPGGSVTNWSRVRLWLSQAGNGYARLMLGLPLHDATSGYRVYRRALLGELASRPITSEGYGFQIELVLRTHRLGYALGESPITFREREHGHSKISRAIVIEALWHVTKWGVALRSGPTSFDA